MSGILAVTTTYRLPAGAFPEGYTPGNLVIGGTMWLVGQGGNLYHHWYSCTLLCLRAGLTWLTSSTSSSPLTCVAPIGRLLANLRRTGSEKGYKVPKGGLFSLVCCPHYACELVAWAGFAVFLNHAAPFCLLSFFVLYLFGRARSCPNPARCLHAHCPPSIFLPWPLTKPKLLVPRLPSKSVVVCTCF